MFRATIDTINCNSSIDLIMRFKVACSRRNLKETFSAVHRFLIKKQKRKKQKLKHNEALSKESC